jgi:anti-sigma regulatory factor (Ser/Thr protein kinase)
VRLFYSQEIRDEGQVGAARRSVHRYAAALGFDNEALAELDIVVQEIGTNAARYAAGGGQLHWTTPLGRDAGLELFYWDKGPGIYDLERVMRDGVSTGGSLGGGLGAIRRLLENFEVYSTVRGTTRRLTNSRRTTHGTAMLGHKWVRTGDPLSPMKKEREADKHIGVWSRPRLGEEVNGDAYFIGERGGSELFAVVDGLGHGYGAREAAKVALASLELWDGEPPDEVLGAVHDVLRSTRGAVMGAVVLDRSEGAFYYSGVGNVEVRVLGSPEPVRPIPNNGTLGARLTGIRVWTYRWSEGTTIVLASDGLSASWDMNAYPGLLGKSPQLLAGVLLRDYGRDSDDATVLVVR